jgi:hypothetical protein
VLPLRKFESGEKRHMVNIGFGNGTLTYPTNGIPLTNASMGMPNYLANLILSSPSPSDGFLYKYDAVNDSIRIYQSAAESATAGPLVELVANTATPAATVILAEAHGW